MNIAHRLRHRVTIEQLATTRDEFGVTLWTLDLIDAAAECRRMHETCRHSKD